MRDRVRAMIQLAHPKFREQLLKILGVSGGKKNGNNDAICKEALSGAAECGAEVEFIRLNDLNLKNCTSCGFCMKGLSQECSNGCVLKDDFEWFRNKVLDADGIVFSIPVFEKGAAGVFHTITDRFGPRHDRGMNLLAAQKAGQEVSARIDARLLKEKVVAFLGMGGTDYTSSFQCDCAILAAQMMWTVVENHVYAWTKVFCMEDEKVAHAHLTGIHLAKAVEDISHAKYYGDPGICPHCHARNFYLNDDASKAICCVCGMEGTLEVTDGRLHFSVEQEQFSHAFDTLDEKLRHAIDVQKNQVIRQQMMRTDTYKKRQEAYISYIQAETP